LLDAVAKTFAGFELPQKRRRQRFSQQPFHARAQRGLNGTTPQADELLKSS
jgi:hypothetical protein